ncbi:SbcC/MukB-like Walker B domain-containing protein, partial [Pseudonocardia lacus]|uniref:SbcC/MukB-like Walker B domain-containing protein n=1 Tax=Pseudonocardia lacus TaxID=2835865 RepID=UPI002738473B
VDGAALRVDAADRAATGWVAKLGEATAAVRDAARTLAGQAAESGAPTTEHELDELQRAVEGYRATAVRWLSAVGDHAAAREKADTALDSVRAGAARAQEALERAEGDEREHRLLAREVETTQASIGTAYHEILAELDRLREQLGAAKGVVRETARAQREVEVDIGGLRVGLRAEEARREAAGTARDAAGARLQGLCAGVLPADAGIELDLTGEDGVRSTLEAARAIAASWPDVPHARRNIEDAFARLAEELHAGRDVLGTRADLVVEPEGDVQVLTALVGGVRMGAAALRARLTEEAARARDDITAAERELFDTTLTGDTRRHIADRIRQATELVDRMNDRLAEVRTASRVAVQLVWQVDPDLPPAARAARELLLRNPARLSEDDRAALHHFFRDRVEQARVEGSATSWEQQLAEVFDYTRWHRFVVRVDRGDGDGWQLLTRRLHGALSGGEKAISLHLPLFAAVAAHYQAVPMAPRIILLDEVFVGVDTTNRGQVFALLASLDLDLVLTSDHEWCAYAELDGIAVHALTTGDDGDDAVTTTRFVWDGHDWQDDG